MNNINTDNDNDNNEYTFYHKKKLAYRIEQIKKKKNYLELFKIINEDSDKYTTNKNGVFFNMNSLKNETLKKIEKFLDDLDLENNNSHIDNITNSIDTEFTPYSVDDFSDYKPMGPKLSNHEKKILKRNNFKKKEKNVIYRQYSQN
jgi:hypothetical protein